MMIENFKFVCPIWILPIHRKCYSKNRKWTRNMKIGIIGAGAAGLVALKHSLDENHDCEVFEKTGFVGGTWNYTEKTGFDDFGLPIHSSMYQGLTTNLPKELMQFEGFPFSKPYHSYISQPEVLQYLNEYSAHFKLFNHIKFFQHVIKVCPISNGRWSVQVEDLKSKFIETKEFDALFICIGNYSVPLIPHFNGLENFQGSVIHSHNFRTTDAYKNRKVLIIGGGPSGIDLARLCKEVTNDVIFCHRSHIEDIRLPDSLKIKRGIQEFYEHSVFFTDGTEDQIDDIILCTGYLYSYPFLSENCDIIVDKKCVKYLYKQIININHPTMAFIGIPFRIFPFIIFGIQVRFFLAYLKGTFTVTKEEMLRELQEFLYKQSTLGLSSGYYHFLGIGQGDYMDDLAETANIKKVPSVFNKLYKYAHTEGKGKKYLTYKILNDEDFIVIEDSHKKSC